MTQTLINQWAPSGVWSLEVGVGVFHDFLFIILVGRSSYSYGNWLLFCGKIPARSEPFGRARFMNQHAVSQELLVMPWMEYHVVKGFWKIWRGQIFWVNFGEWLANSARYNVFWLVEKTAAGIEVGIRVPASCAIPNASTFFHQIDALLLIASISIRTIKRSSENLINE